MPFFDTSDRGLQPVTLLAVAQVELVAEKLLALIQLKGCFEPARLRQAVDAELALTRYKRWKPGLRRWP